MHSKTINLEELSNIILGEVFFDSLHKSICATDASVYRKIPLGVVFPKTGKHAGRRGQFVPKNKEHE